MRIARAKYFLTLATLKGKRPFAHTKTTMDTVDNLLSSAISLHRTYSYILTLALFKMDFARHGLNNILNEARKMFHETSQMTRISEDTENIDLLISCQPDLIKDYMSL
jgi:hypothetical protein